MPCHGKPGRHGDEPLRGRHACGGKGVNNPFGLLSVERCGGTCRLGRARQEISTANEFIADSRCPVRPLPDPPHNPPQIRVTEARVKKLQAQVNEVFHKEKLCSGLAGKLWGRLQFASTQAYGRTGRAMLRALNRRQHEGGRHGLNLQLKSCITWWIRHLPVLPAGPVPINMEKRRVMISYSDGEGLVHAGGRAQGQKMARAGIVRIPDDLRTQWDSKRKGNRYNDIYEVEAVGPLLVLANFGVDLIDCLWLHVDNSGALSSLVRGGSSVESGDHITGLTWSHIVGVGCICRGSIESFQHPTPRMAFFGSGCRAPGL